MKLDNSLLWMAVRHVIGAAGLTIVLCLVLVGMQPG
jgi:hypothetical protein